MIPKITLNPTANVTEPTTYKFGLETTWGSESVTKNFYLTVNENPSKSTTQPQESGNSLADSSKTATKALLAAGVSLSVVVSAASMSSPQGALSMLNQFQLFILLPMIGAYIPPNVIEVILSMDLAMFSFSMIPFEKIPLTSSLFKYIDYDQSDAYVDRVGLTSGSAILNHLGILLVVLVLVLFHLSIFPCYDASKRLSKKN